MADSGEIPQDYDSLERKQPTAPVVQPAGEAELPQHGDLLRQLQQTIEAKNVKLIDKELFEALALLAAYKEDWKEVEELLRIDNFPSPTNEGRKQPNFTVDNRSLVELHKKLQQFLRLARYKHLGRDVGPAYNKRTLTQIQNTTLKRVAQFLEARNTYVEKYCNADVYIFNEMLKGYLDNEVIQKNANEELKKFLVTNYTLAQELGLPDIPSKYINEDVLQRITERDVRVMKIIENCMRIDKNKEGEIEAFEVDKNKIKQYLESLQLEADQQQIDALFFIVKVLIDEENHEQLYQVSDSLRIPFEDITITQAAPYLNEKMEILDEHLGGAFEKIRGAVSKPVLKRYMEDGISLPKLPKLSESFKKLKFENLPADVKLELTKDIRAALENKLNDNIPDGFNTIDDDKLVAEIGNVLSYMKGNNTTLLSTTDRTVGEEENKRTLEGKPSSFSAREYSIMQALKEYISSEVSSEAVINSLLIYNRDETVQKKMVETITDMLTDSSDSLSHDEALQLLFRLKLSERGTGKPQSSPLLLMEGLRLLQSQDSVLVDDRKQGQITIQAAGEIHIAHEFMMMIARTAASGKLEIPDGIEVSDEMMDFLTYQVGLGVEQYKEEETTLLETIKKYKLPIALFVLIAGGIVLFRPGKRATEFAIQVNRAKMQNFTRGTLAEFKKAYPKLAQQFSDDEIKATRRIAREVLHDYNQLETLNFQRRGALIRTFNRIKQQQAFDMVELVKTLKNIRNPRSIIEKMANKAFLITDSDPALVARLVNKTVGSREELTSIMKQAGYADEVIKDAIHELGATNISHFERQEKLFAEAEELMKRTTNVSTLDDATRAAEIESLKADFKKLSTNLENAAAEINPAFKEKFIKHLQQEYPHLPQGSMSSVDEVVEGAISAAPRITHIEQLSNIDAFKNRLTYILEELDEINAMKTGKIARLREFNKNTVRPFMKELAVFEVDHPTVRRTLANQIMGDVITDADWDIIKSAHAETDIVKKSAKLKALEHSVADLPLKDEARITKRNNIRKLMRTGITGEVALDAMIQPSTVDELADVLKGLSPKHWAPKITTYLKRYPGQLNSVGNMLDDTSVVTAAKQADGVAELSRIRSAAVQTSQLLRRGFGHAITKGLPVAGFILEAFLIRSTYNQLQAAEKQGDGAQIELLKSKLDTDVQAFSSEVVLSGFMYRASQLGQLGVKTTIVGALALTAGHLTKDALYTYADEINNMTYDRYRSERPDQNLQTIKGATFAALVDPEGVQKYAESAALDAYIENLNLAQLNELDMLYGRETLAFKLAKSEHKSYEEILNSQNLPRVLKEEKESFIKRAIAEFVQYSEGKDLEWGERLEQAVAYAELKHKERRLKSLYGEKAWQQSIDGMPTLQGGLDQYPVKTMTPDEVLTNGGYNTQLLEAYKYDQAVQWLTEFELEVANLKTIDNQQDRSFAEIGVKARLFTLFANVFFIHDYHVYLSKAPNGERHIYKQASFGPEAHRQFESFLKELSGKEHIANRVKAVLNLQNSLREAFNPGNIILQKGKSNYFGD